MIQAGTASSLSPDGRYLAQLDFDRGSFRLAVRDTTTGATVLDAPYPLTPNPPRWSPDNQWLVWPDSNGVNAWNRTSDTHTMPVATNLGTVVAAVATATPSSQT